MRNSAENIEEVIYMGKQNLWYISGLRRSKHAPILSPLGRRRAFYRVRYTTKQRLQRWIGLLARRATHQAKRKKQWGVQLDWWKRCYLPGLATVQRYWGDGRRVFRCSGILGLKTLKNILTMAPHRGDPLSLTRKDDSEYFSATLSLRHLFSFILICLYHYLTFSGSYLQFRRSQAACTGLYRNAP